MVNYENGKIYTIRNRTDDNLIYIGSTTQSLSKRFGKHKEDKERRPNSKLYCAVEDWKDWYIELYEIYPCNCKEELHRREGEVIRQIGTLNRCIAGRTIKEYKQEHKEYYKEYMKKYNHENHKFRVLCECGTETSKHHLKRHQQSKKHFELLKNE